MELGPNNKLRFTNIHVENWKNFASIDVALQRRVFLVGPNASGKSNLLDVFRFLNDIVSTGGGFQEAIEKRDGITKIRCLSARSKPSVAIRAKIGTDENISLWEYELRFTQEANGQPIIEKETIVHNGEILDDRPNGTDKEDLEQLTQTYLEQVNVNKKYRQLAEFFSSICYLHVVPQLVREPDRSIGKKNDPFGGDFLAQLAKTPVKKRNAWLRKIQNALRVAVPQLEKLELWQEKGQGKPHLHGKYAHWRPQGAWQTEEQFSDGTLRLVGLLWAMLKGDGPLLLEEPELSLHPEVVRFIPQMFARMQRRTGHQILISTHSSELLKDDGIGLDEVLLMMPGEDGTQVKIANQFKEIEVLLKEGCTMAEAVMPRTRPANVEQLTLFGELK